MKMAAANPLWGAPRIHGELGRLGSEVSERSVSRLVRRPRRPPSQTWRTFLTNHVAALSSIDFFTVPTGTGRVLFVFVGPRATLRSDLDGVRLISSNRYLVAAENSVLVAGIDVIPSYTLNF
jgi:hypothetical protein